MTKKKGFKIDIDFLSMDSIKNKNIEGKIDFILNPVKKGHMIVLDGVLSSEEELKLVEATLHNVKGDFAGIEVATLPREMKGFDHILNSILARLSSLSKKITGKEIVTIKNGLTLVGPSSIVKRVKRDPDSFHITAEV
ncbi:MAG: DUF2073 domain-containing protein [archaeon]